MKPITTIGFSKKPLEKFVGLLQKSGVTRLIDTRLNNTSQLSGFAKRDDLHFIMKLVGVSYVHDLSLAPTEDMLTAYKQKQMKWDEYENRYLDLLQTRKVENNIPELVGDETICLLCSEDKPHHCHRRLLAEYLQGFDQNIKIYHL